jgi:cardiolipin synthase
MDFLLHTFPILMIIHLVIAFATSISIVFIERKNSSSVFAWLIVVFLIPYVGFIFYIIFSQNIARQKIYKYTADEKKYIKRTIAEQIDNDFLQEKKEFRAWKGLISLHQKYANAYFSDDNEVEIFTDGQVLFDSLLTSIKGAKEEINIEYFIIKNDFVGRKFINALTEKAKEGVAVHLLVDASGSKMIQGKATEEFIKSGGKFAVFFPPKFRFLQLKLNFRNHRKLAIFDNEHFYIGGFNVAKEYVDKKKKFGHWRDTHLKVSGGSVLDASFMFALDYRQASKQDIIAPKLGKGNHENGVGMQIVNSGPNSHKEEIKHGFLRMISYAEKHIYIQTPYFTPDEGLLEALMIASLSGVDVRIMLPTKKDHPFVHWVSSYYSGILLEAGVRVFMYDGGFLHSKVITVDSDVSTVGSANFDIRSFRLNFETTAFIYDKKIAKQLELNFIEDQLSCHEILLKDYRKRSLWTKFREHMCRLLSDIT